MLLLPTVLPTTYFFLHFLQVRTLVCVPLSTRSSTVRAVERFSVRVDNLTLNAHAQRTSECLPKICEANNRDESMTDINASL